MQDGKFRDKADKRYVTSHNFTANFTLHNNSVYCTVFCD